MLKKNDTEKVIIVLGMSLLFLLFSLYPFSHPHSDDFSYFTFLNENTYWDATKLVYKFSGGRYLSTILIFLSPLANHNVQAYPILTSSIFLFFLLSAYWSLKTFLYLNKNSKTFWAIYFFIVGVYLTIMPNIHEFIYWLCAEATYLTAASFWLLTLALLTKLVLPTDKPKYLNWIMLNIAMIGLLGCSEVSIMLYLIPLYIHFSIRKQYDTLLHFGFLSNVIIYVALVLIVTITSGNVGRHNITPFSGQIMLSIFGGLYAASQLLVNMLVLVLPASVCFVLFFGEKLKPLFTNLLHNFSVFRPINIMISTIVFVVLSQIVVVWMTGSVPELRYQNVIYLVFILSMTLLLQTLYTQYDIKKSALTYKIQNLCVIYLFVLFSFVPNNYVKATWDLFSGTSYNFNKQQNERISIINNQTNTIAVVPPITAKPFTLFFPTLSCSSYPDKNDLPRMGLANYFGKKWIYEYPCSSEKPIYSIKEQLKEFRKYYFSK